MITLNFVFWMFVILFAVIGTMRGWAKELLVSSSVILAIFVITVMESYVPFVRDSIGTNLMNQFWTRSVIIALMVFFGYQTPNIPRIAQRAVREHLQDSLLGIFLGALNGYLIVGSLWFYLNKAGYPFDFMISPGQMEQVCTSIDQGALHMEDICGPVTQAASDFLALLPPSWLGSVPIIYFAIAVVFTFVIIVFI